MIKDLTSQKTAVNIVTKKQVNESKELFSFLTDFESKANTKKTVHLDSSLQLKSRITTKGKIKFCNSDFCTATNYSSKNIQNKAITSVFHPEMPKVIMNVIKNNLENKTNALAVIKQIDSDGNTIWVNTLFNPNTTSKLNIACHIKSNPSSKKTIKKIDKIYNTLFLLEHHVSHEIAEKYFEGLLEMEYGNYEGLLIDLFQ